MSIRVCLSTHNTLYYPEGGGHLWVFLNWALGLRALGCEVIWLERIAPDTPASEVREKTATLKSYLKPHGLADCVALCSWGGEPLSPEAADGCLDLDAAAGADLLLNFRYNLAPEIVARFRRSALVDLDPGQLQVWMSRGQLSVAPHDAYFTTGETVGTPEAKFPDAGIEWHHTPPPVHLPAWEPDPADPSAPFTTVSNWSGEWLEIGGELFNNEKRTSFLEYLDLPSRTEERLELALCLGGENGDRRLLEENGWTVRHAWDVSSTPGEYRDYVRRSRGEFSCAKPSCTLLRNAWISDRTLCYLASGRPAVVQHTGPSRILPEWDGLFRFRSVEEAALAIQTVADDYERQSRRARSLAGEHFAAEKVTGNVLERTLA